MKEGSGPIYMKQYRQDDNKHKALTEVVNNLEKDGVIEKSFSPYNFPVFLRPKNDKVRL